MNVAINICPKNIVDFFCNILIDFYGGGILGVKYVFTNLLMYSKVIVLCDKFSCAYTMDGMSINT